MTQKDHRKAWQHAENTLEYIIAHPAKARLKALVSGGNTGRAHDKYLAKILLQMGLMVPDLEFIKAIKANLITHQEQDDRKRLHALYILLCKKFNILYDRAIAAKKVDEQAFKKLKKLIHSFAEKHDFERHLFNLKKNHGEHATTAIAAGITKRRKYAYIPDRNNELTEEKYKRRVDKQFLNFLSWLFTFLFVGTQGMATVYFAQSLLLIGLAAAFIPLPPIALSILIFGIPGMLINGFLYKQINQEALKQLFITHLFKNENGEPLPRWKKNLLISSIGITLLTGSIFGILSFGMAKGALVGVLASLGISALFPPAGIVIGGVIISSLIALSVIALSYIVFTDLIKNDRIPQALNYFKNTYFTLPEKSLKGVMKHILRCAVELGFLMLGIAGATFITIISAGLSHHVALNFLAGSAGIGMKASSYLATAFTAIGYAVKGSQQIEFTTNAILHVKDFLSKTIKGIGHFALHPQKATRNVWQSMKANPIRAVENITTFIFRAAVFIGTAIKAYSESGGAFSKSNQKYVDRFLNTDSQTGPDLEFVDTWSSIVSINTNTIISSSHRPRKVPFEETAKNEVRNTFEKNHILSDYGDSLFHHRASQPSKDASSELEQEFHPVNKL